MFRTTSPWSPTIATAVSLAMAALFLMLAGASPASAHTGLVSATPESGKRVVVGAPLTVALTFTEAIDPALANVVLLDEADQTIDSTPVSVDGPTVTLVTRHTPEPGAYVVRYRVVSADGHPVDGETRFTVAAPKPASEPAETADATAEPEPEPTSPAQAAVETSAS